MARLLIVDDEPKIRELIAKYALYDGHTVVQAENGMEAVERCRQEDFDLIVMDVMMPELDGFSACREISRSKSIPVLMLSARGEEYDRIHGFELGIDDYVVKPFSPKELMMRIQAILRRSAAASAGAVHTEMQCKGLRVDESARLVYVDQQRIKLPPKQYELLVYLMRNKGLALSREQLLTHVWGYEYFGDDRTLDTHIKLLRKELGPYADMIVTLRGVGYRFEENI